MSPELKRVFLALALFPFTVAALFLAAIIGLAASQGRSR